MLSPPCEFRHQMRLMLALETRESPQIQPAFHTPTPFTPMDRDFTWLTLSRGLSWICVTSSPAGVSG